MAVQAAVQHIGQQHGVVERPDLNALDRAALMIGEARAAENPGVIFHILPDFQDRVVLQQRLQQR